MRGTWGKATGTAQVTEFVIVMGTGRDTKAFTSPRGRNADLRQRWTYDPDRAYVYPSYQAADRAIERGKAAGWGDMQNAQYCTVGEWLAEMATPEPEPQPAETQPETQPESYQVPAASLSEVVSRIDAANQAMQSWEKEKAAIMVKAYQYGGGLTTMQRERIAILEKSLQDMGRTVDVMRATLDLLGLPVFLSQPAESQPAPIVYSLTE